MEWIVLLIFAVSLFLCIGFNVSILIALVFGFFLFFGYGIYKKHTCVEMFSMAVSGVKTVKNILVTFVLIGMITAIWRAGGTIPYIVYHSTKICNPHVMVLITFLLCSLISFLTGTAFGTAATMGVICVTMANSMGIPIFYTGGAVLAGSYFGDRCSPMSTSALLVSSLTDTSLFENIVDMVKTSLVPFGITCLFYLIAGMGLEVHPDSSGVQGVFAEYFELHPAVLLPAAAIVLLSLFKINVKITMGISIVCGVAVSVWIQEIAPLELLRIAILGYQPENAAVAAVLSGGGILSMVKVFCIVCISSCYAGMFAGTGLLNGLQEKMVVIGEKITPFGGIFLTSILTGMISCNQTLTIMLTHQLCGESVKDSRRMASYLENTAVVIAPLVPWSIAATVPLASVGAPIGCVLAGCYLYLLPIWNYAVALCKSKISVECSY